ncbi:type-1 angiotensin II receptor-like [Mya arenaria]|uniref:type-1 angiotensin II receptor-like n=1 Tax=Mya arenaria TaxID=6604 RepID=UPI0022E1252A|nr:type-1 angiotensin II receptor-like [Mya arenaria]
MEEFGEKFYAYVTPCIILIGLFGNSLSLRVFLSKNLRSMSASRYLAALSTADLCTLVFYVFCEWLRRGVSVIFPEFEISFFEFRGVCQTWNYIHYTFRLISSWLIVAFTCERFIGVCMPMRRRNLGSLKDTSRIICGICFVSGLVALYKPIMSDVQNFRGKQTCARNSEFASESFVLDIAYAILIAMVPFLIITTLNILIIRKLLKRQRSLRYNFINTECHIRLEFTLILLAISFFFIAFNLPYFVIWVKQYIETYMNSKSSDMELEDIQSFQYWRGVLLITRTIFYMNYCINFFLYSVTGAYFRRELRMLFFGSHDRSRYEECNRTATGTNNKNFLLLHYWFVNDRRNYWFVNDRRNYWFVNDRRNYWFVNDRRNYWFVNDRRNYWFVNDRRNYWFVNDRRNYWFVNDRRN